MTFSFKFKRGDLIIPPVRIEHVRSYSPMMAIDTGSKVTVITPRLAEEVGVKLTGEELSVQLIGVAGSARAPVVTLRRVSVMGLGVENLRAICHPLPPRLELEGILGLNFLQHFNLSIHHDTETVSLEKIS